jgi:hypothetical protein
MRKPNRSILISGGAAVLAIGLTTTTALAATGSGHGGQPGASGSASWSVSPMNTVEGGDSVGQTVLADSTTGGKIKCTSESAGYDIKGGMDLTGTVTGKLAGVTMQFGGCALPDGTAVTVTESNEWAMTGVRFDPSTNLGVTTGRWRGVDISFSSSTCSGVLDGSAAGANDGILTYEFYNNPHWLIVRTYGGDLHAYNVTGCTGIFGNGDPVTMHTISTGTDIVITSP